jgi:hypothetical protein
MIIYSLILFIAASSSVWQNQQRLSGSRFPVGPGTQSLLSSSPRSANHFPPKCFADHHLKLQSTTKHELAHEELKRYITAMASRKLAGDSTRHEQLQSEDHDGPQTNVSSCTEAQNLNTTASRTVIRRRRPDPKLHPIQAMSFVGLKNLFFRRTITPVPRTMSKYDWSNGSSQPLLRPGEHSNQSMTETNQTAPTDSDNGDIESQSVDSKTEKANQKKGFRIDARIISDATIGLSDGLTVPFALTAGLSALGNTKVVIYGGFAELIAGAISMGLGGYLGAKSEA